MEDPFPNKRATIPDLVSAEKYEEPINRDEETIDAANTLVLLSKQDKLKSGGFVKKTRKMKKRRHKKRTMRVKRLKSKK